MTSEHSSAIVTAFSRIAAARRHDAALISPARRASFGDVERLSIAMADRIVSASLRHGVPIAFSAHNGPAFLAGILALRRTGHVPVLLDPFAPAVDRERAATAIGAAAMISCDTGWPHFDDAELDITPVVQQFAAPLPAEVAVIKLTSGSTGTPRGVAMSESQLLSDEDALARTMGITAEDRLLCTLPLSHSYGFTTFALAFLVRGVSLVLPADQGPFAPLQAGRELNATVFPTVPTYLQGLLRMSEPPAWPESIRLVISAGAVLSAQTASEFRHAFGQPVHVFYGSSECGGICYDRDGGAAERGTVGSPVDGVELTMASPDADEPGGLVTVRSAAVGVSYWPLADKRLQDGRFETMDLASWQNGELRLNGRADYVINLRGKKVDPSEVEGVIAALPGVNEAVVLAVAAPDGGHVVRAVVASSSGDLTYARIAAWCRDRLAQHKVPRSIILVDEIPRTARGKIDRVALARLGAAPDVTSARG